MTPKNPYTQPSFAKAFEDGYRDAMASAPENRPEYKWGGKAKAYHMGRAYGSQVQREAENKV